MPPWPFDVSILCTAPLVFTLNMIYRTCVMWHAMFSHHRRLWVENPTRQCKIIIIFWMALQSMGDDSSHHVIGRSDLYSYRHLVIMGWSTHELMESSKGYSISKWSVSSTTADILFTVSKGAQCHINNGEKLHKDSLSSLKFTFNMRRRGIFARATWFDERIVDYDEMWLPGTSQLRIMMVLFWGVLCSYQNTIQPPLMSEWEAISSLHCYYSTTIKWGGAAVEDSTAWVLMDVEAVINNELLCVKPILELWIYYAGSWKTHILCIYYNGGGHV